MKAGGELGLQVRVLNRGKEISRGVLVGVFLQGRKIGQLSSPADLAPASEVLLTGKVSLPSQIPDSQLAQSPKDILQLQVLPARVADLCPTDIAVEPMADGLRWTVTVVNQGQAPASGLPYRLTFDGQMLLQKKVLEAIAPGQAQSIVFVDKRPIASGKHKLVCLVDPDGELEDANPSNNEYRLEWQAGNQRPDLTIRSWSAEPTVVQLGQPINILFSVTNTAEIELYKVPVALLVDGKVVQEKKFFQPIAADSETELQWSWMPTAVGQHQLQMVLMNQKSPLRTITVEGRPGYRLQLVSANVPRRSPQGKDWIVEVVVQNQGSESCEGLKAVLWADGTRVWSARANQPLAAGQQASLELRWSAERVGKHQLRLEINGQSNKVDEQSDIKQVYPVDVEPAP